MKGFRKGHIPDSVVKEKVSEEFFWSQMVEAVFPDVYIDYMQKNKIEALGRPKVSMGEVKTGEGVTVTATLSLLPSVTVGDYEALAKKVFGKKVAVKVEDVEVDKAIDELRRMKAHSRMQGEGNTEIKISDVKPGDFDAFDDEFVKSLGLSESAEDFKKRVTENLKQEKQSKEAEKMKIEFSEKLVEESTVLSPKILVDMELDKLVGQLEYEVSRGGVSFEDYLKESKKSVEDLRAEWLGDATKRVHLQLILNSIAVKENIVPSEELVTKEFDHLKKMYGTTKDFSELRAKSYITEVLTHQLVLTQVQEKATAK
jgi:trigger factor